ncbi:hypothetical protein ONZ45_g11630 [Pleurotus djamor]|nr:hypothetical protein ONZ45_g11630 [Pleurotus djamor]
MVSFGQNHIKGLQVRLPPQPQSFSTENQALHALLLSKSLPSVQDVIPLLESPGSISETETERQAVVDAITARLVMNVYAETLDTLMEEAGMAESESEWWANVERSKANVAWYLLQTLPKRIADTIQYVGHAVRTRNVTASSLFLSPHPGFNQPTPALISLFPHLNHQKASFNFSGVSPLRALVEARSSSPDLQQAVSSAWARLNHIIADIYRIFTIPLRLTEQECHYKRVRLRKIRNQRAESLGSLAQRRNDLEAALLSSGPQMRERLASFLANLENDTLTDRKTPSDAPPLLLLNEFVTSTFPTHKASHLDALHSASLFRPSRLTRIWPKLVLLPPLAWLAVRTLYNRRSNLYELYQDAIDTMQGFLRGWVLDPINDILRTVKSGGDDERGIIVRAEGVKADMESLQRMAIALAQEELGYTTSQLETLRERVGMGDLTPIAEIYEEGIKRPVKSALFGSLIRSVFIQVQKTKVDVDQALTGIDKLIRSQELTFAFVGVAPALAIVYVFGGYLRRTFVGGVLRITGNKGEGRFGGRQRREGIFRVVRRIEKLLTTSTPNNQLTPLTQGLLLLSVNQLREFAYECLPAQSGFRPSEDAPSPVRDSQDRAGEEKTNEAEDVFDNGTGGLREGFLEDVADLENPSLSRADKLRVLDRMWRCWGASLGWHKQGA